MQDQCITSKTFQTFTIPITGEYDQNLCPNGNSTCQKCPERLPSCIGLPDGDNPIPTHEWTSRYITCYKNRTLLPVHKCPKPKIYHPVKKICTEDIKPSKNYINTYK